MAAALVHNAYGKSQVRLTKVQRPADRHDLIDWSIDVRLEGDFAAAFTEGDNQQVVPTDTMKNVVYALARDHALAALYQAYQDRQPGMIFMRIDPRFAPLRTDARFAELQQHVEQASWEEIPSLEELLRRAKT